MRHQIELAVLRNDKVNMEDYFRSYSSLIVLPQLQKDFDAMNSQAKDLTARLQKAIGKIVLVVSEVHSKCRETLYCAYLRAA